MSIVQELAKAFGISPILVEGGLSSILLSVVVLLVRQQGINSKTDEKQVTVVEELVKLTASTIDEQRKLRLSYEDNIRATKDNSEVLKSLVEVARELKTAVPEQITKQEQAILSSFMARADEMQKITEQRNEEHKQLLEKLEEHQRQVEAIKKEITDAVDPTTLRSELNRMVESMDKVIKLAEKAITKEEVQP